VIPVDIIQVIIRIIDWRNETKSILRKLVDENLIALNSIIDLISDLTEILSMNTNHEYIFYILSFKPHLI